jgi:hypothetical protein
MDAQEICFKIILKFILKKLLHVSVQSPSSGSVLLAGATPPNQPQRCILTDYFNNYNLASSNNTLPVMVIEPKHVAAVLM